MLLINNIQITLSVKGGSESPFFIRNKSYLATETITRQNQPSKNHLFL